jgi:hypothetical protein
MFGLALFTASSFDGLLHLIVDENYSIGFDSIYPTEGIKDCTEPVKRIESLRGYESDNAACAMPQP